MGFFGPSNEEKKRQQALEAELLRQELAAMGKAAKRGGKAAKRVVQKGTKIINGGREIEVTEYDPNTKQTTTYRRPTDKKLQKEAEKEFKKKGSPYWTGTVSNKEPLQSAAELRNGLKGSPSSRVSGKMPNGPVNKDGSPRSSWW